MRDYHARPESKFIDSTVGKSWVSASDIADKANNALGNTDKNKVNEYDIRKVADMNPDYESSYDRVGRDYQWKIRRISTVEKSVKNRYQKPQKSIIMGIKR